MAAWVQQVHHHGAQEGEELHACALGVAISILTQLGVAGPVPLVVDAPAVRDQEQQGSGVVRMLVKSK